MQSLTFVTSMVPGAYPNIKVLNKSKNLTDQKTCLIIFLEIHTRAVQIILCMISLTLSVLRHCSLCSQCSLRGFSSEAENPGYEIQSVISWELLHLGPWNLVHLWQLECFIIYLSFKTNFTAFLIRITVPSQLKPHLKLLSLCSAFASTWCQRKCIKNTWNPSLCANIFTGSSGQAVSFSHFPVLKPGAHMLLQKFFYVTDGYVWQPDCCTEAVACYAMRQITAQGWMSYCM